MLHIINSYNFVTAVTVTTVTVAAVIVNELMNF